MAAGLQASEPYSAPSTGNAFRGNVYEQKNVEFFWTGATRSWTSWRSLGNDTTGSATTH